MIRYQISLICLVAILFTGCSFFKDTEAFKATQKYLENHPTVSEHLGPIKDYGNPMGSYNLSGGHGDAKFTFNVKGEKQGAEVKIELKKASFDWEVVSAFIKADDGKIFDLVLYDKRPKSPLTFEFTNIFLSKSKGGAPLRSPAKFKAGEKLHVHTSGHGLKVDGKNHVAVRYYGSVLRADGNMQALGNIINSEVQSPKGTVELYFWLETNASMVSDKPHKINLYLEDKQTKKTISASTSFLVEAKE